MRTLLAVALVLAVAAAGCGGEEEDPATTTTAAPAAATAAAESDSPTATATETAQAAAGEITPLGTTLKVGESATIAYEDASNKKKSTIELTPEKIEKGSLEDFENIDLDAQQRKSTPYYATIAVKNVGRKDLSGASPATYINGVDDRGQDQNEVIFFGDFDRCDQETPKSLKPGEGYEACLVYLIPKGGSLEGFHWIQFDEKSGESDLFWER